MNCNRCHEPIGEGASWQIQIPDHGTIGVCRNCYNEYFTLITLSKTILERSVRDWYEGVVESDSIPEFDTQRHRILSLASERMYGLIAALTETNHIESVISTKQKMYELYEEIKEALEESEDVHDWSTAPSSKMTREDAIRMLDQLPSNARTVLPTDHPHASINAINLNATLILLLGAILKQTIEGFLEGEEEEDKPCAHGQE